VSTHDASLWGLVLTVLGKSQTPKRCGGLVDGRAGFEMERLVFVHMTAYGKLLFTADSDFESCRKPDDSRDCEANDGRGCSANGLLDRRRCQGETLETDPLRLRQARLVTESPADHTERKNHQ
jgi:hypothetical protein